MLPVRSSAKTVDEIRAGLFRRLPKVRAIFIPDRHRDLFRLYEERDEPKLRTSMTSRALHFKHLIDKHFGEDQFKQFLI